MSLQAQRDISRKLKVFEHAVASSNVAFTCRHFGISRDTFYQWKRAYAAHEEKGLINSKPCPENPKLRTPALIEEKILYLHHNLNRLPDRQRKRSIPTIRYEKQVPGHHAQVDVKFLDFKVEEGKKIRRFQYTAIDDATRIRVLKMYERHTQQNAIDFVNYVIGKFPFRINAIRTDNGHEFQAKFHWQLEDMGVRHAYIKPRTPRLNGKVERSYGTDQREFYQL